MFAPAGCPERGQFWLRYIMQRMYDDGPMWFSGDEDNGSMSSWFLLSAMGLYQLVPGSTAYSIGTPLYRHLRIELDNGRVLNIEAEGNSRTTPYVHRVTLNGTELDNLTVEYDALRRGGTLSFVMGEEPA